MASSQLFCPAPAIPNHAVFITSIGRVMIRRLVISLLWLLATSAVQGQISFFAPLTDGCSGVLFEADFNGDGKPDLLCSSPTGGTILLLGNGDGTFATGGPVAGNPLAVADINDDGKPDIVEQGTGTLLVLLGNGDGTFQPAISTASGASLTVLVAGDLNGDGRADVVGVFNGTLLVYVSKGDGTFEAGVPYSMGGSSAGLTLAILGDLNGDGKVDVAVMTAGDNVAGQIIVFLGNGNGTLQPAKTSAGVYYPSVAVEGDFNGDGKVDLAIAGSAASGAKTVFIQLGNGDGTFQAPTQAFSGATSFLAAADLNGDGNLDLVVATGVVDIHFGKGDGTFPSIESYQLPPNTYTPGIAIADFNLDGSLDIASGSSLLLANGDGTFEGWPAVSLPSLPLGVATGSFDQRAAKDLAVTVSYRVGGTPANAVDILIPDAMGAPVLAHSYTLHQSPGAIATADLNGDGNLDLVVAGNDPGTGEWGYTVLRGNGDGTFRTPLSYPQSVVTSAGQMVVADFNNDHKPDIAIALGNQNIAVLLGNGDGTFGPPSYYFDNGAGIIMSADFNSDGNVDLAATLADNSVQTPTAFLFGKGDGTFQPAVFPLGQYAAFSTGDFNNDGKADLLGNGASGLQVLLGNGDGTFSALPPSWIEPPNLFFSGGQLLADINSDGNLDIIVSLYQGVHIDHQGVFPGNGDGTFGPFVDVLDFVDYIPSAYVLAAPDVNGDGKPDLVFVDTTINDIFVLLNTTSPGPGVKLSPSSISFPSTNVGSTSGPVPVTLTNTGQVALSVSAVSITGAQANQFSQTNTCTSVQPNTTCTINVMFTPAAAGNAAASLTITDNATGSPQAVALSGVATGADIGLGVSGGSSQTVTAGSTATYALSIGGKGWSGETSLTCTGAPAGANCSVTPSSPMVSATSASQVQVSVTTTANTMAEVGPRGSGLSPWLWALAIVGMILPSSARRRPLTGKLLLTCLFTSSLLLVSCSGGSNSHNNNNRTPAGSYSLTVAAKAASGSPNQSVTLTLNVQ